MKITDVPFAVLRLQYQIARFPLHLIEQQISARVDPEAPGRLFYERSLGTLDATVGGFLGDAGLQERGAALLERSEALKQAAKLEAEASAKLQDADQTLKRKADKAIQDQKEARETRQEEVEQAKADADERKRTAAETAAKRAATAKKQADEVAAKRVENVEAAKRAQQNTINKAEEKVVKAADAQRDDAAQKRSDAAAKRAQADKVEALADVEKQSRQTT
ncbi:MAG: IF2 family translation initiation factor [Mycobacterium sp.]